MVKCLAILVLTIKVAGGLVATKEQRYTRSMSDLTPAFREQVQEYLDPAKLKGIEQSATPDTSTDPVQYRIVAEYEDGSKVSVKLYDSQLDAEHKDAVDAFIYAGDDELSSPRN